MCKFKPGPFKQHARKTTGQSVSAELHGRNIYSYVSEMVVKELDSRLRDSSLERRQLQTENEAAFCAQEKSSIRILQNKNQAISSPGSSKNRQGFRKWLPRINVLFRCGEKDEPSTPATRQQADEYSVVAVCDTNDIGNECLQLQFTPLSIPTSTGAHQSLAQKYLSSPASDVSCDLTETISLYEF